MCHIEALLSQLACNFNKYDMRKTIRLYRDICWHITTFRKILINSVRISSTWNRLRIPFNGLQIPALRPKRPYGAYGSHYKRMRAIKLHQNPYCEICQREKPNPAEWEFSSECHHIDGNPLNNSLENLQMACKWCHHKEHRRRKYQHPRDNKRYFPN